MSLKELDRYQILTKVRQRELSQVDAARLLGISDRQIRNLTTKLNRWGRIGIVSKKRGKPSNRCKKREFRERVLALVREQYGDCGPTFAAEKLAEINGIEICPETLRLWMIDSKLWIPRNKKSQRHVPRARRACFGELIQADGSPDHWFGDDLPEANATVFVDDATSRITALHFSETETLEAYYEGLRQHINHCGRPRALYTDKYCVFYSKAARKTTNMGRALRELDVQLILANTPQAKGRVERTNRTLQDRLKKELRLRGIKTIPEANLYAKEFVKAYNNRFSKLPANAVDAHRPLEGHDLDRILCIYDNRVLTSSGTFQFNNTTYVLQGGSIKNPKGVTIEVRVTRSNAVKAFYRGQELTIIPSNQLPDPILNHKEVLVWKIRGVKHQPATHPWKQDYARSQKVKQMRASMV